MVLAAPHHANRRKFDTYRALDNLEANTPILAFPILSEEGGRSAQDSLDAAQTALYERLGLKRIEVTGQGTGISDEVVERLLRREVGGELIDIQELIKDG